MSEELTLEERTRIAKAETQILPPLFPAECMGYLGEGKHVEPHIYFDTVPHHKGSTGVCDDCMNLYIPQNGLHRQTT